MQSKLKKGIGGGIVKSLLCIAVDALERSHCFKGGVRTGGDLSLVQDQKVGIQLP